MLKKCKRVVFERMERSRLFDIKKIRGVERELVNIGTKKGELAGLKARR